MIVTVLSKRQFEDMLILSSITDDNVSDWRGFSFISICCTEHPEAGWESQPYFRQNHRNVLRMWFDDVTKDVVEMAGMIEHTYLAFTEDQGRELIAFLDQQDRRGCVQQIFVHCTAGISRSGAVGAFINEYFGGRYAEFKQRNPQIQPNATVSAVLNGLVREKQTV